MEETIDYHTAVIVKNKNNNNLYLYDLQTHKNIYQIPNLNTAKIISISSPIVDRIILQYSDRLELRNMKTGELLDKFTITGSNVEFCYKYVMIISGKEYKLTILEITRSKFEVIDTGKHIYYECLLDRYLRFIDMNDLYDIIERRFIKLSYDIIRDTTNNTLMLIKEEKDRLDIGELEPATMTYIQKFSIAMKSYPKSIEFLRQEDRYYVMMLIYTDLYMYSTYSGKLIPLEPDVRSIKYIDNDNLAFNNINSGQVSLYNVSTAISHSIYNSIINIIKPLSRNKIMISKTEVYDIENRGTRRIGFEDSIVSTASSKTPELYKKLVDIISTNTINISGNVNRLIANFI